MSKEDARLAEFQRDYAAQLEKDDELDSLASVVKDVWGSLVSYWTDMPEAEVQRLIAKCESVNELLGREEGADTR